MIPQSPRSDLLDLPFSMIVEDVVIIPHRGMFVIGKVETGSLKKGDEIQILGKETFIDSQVIAFEGFIRNPENYVAMPGDNIAIQIGDIHKEIIQSGMIVIAVPDL